MGGVILLKVCGVLRALVRGGRYVPIVLAVVVAARVLAADPVPQAATAPQSTPTQQEPLDQNPYLPGGIYQPHQPFPQGGPIGSQTEDGYNALGPEVTQPIEFPHVIHVEKMGIDCMYCHTYARRSAVSGIPRLSKCIGCHQNIESVKDKPRIKVLLITGTSSKPYPGRRSTTCRISCASIMSGISSASSSNRAARRAKRAATAMVMSGQGPRRAASRRFRWDGASAVMKWTTRSMRSATRPAMGPAIVGNATNRP